MISINCFPQEQMLFNQVVSWSSFPHLYFILKFSKLLEKMKALWSVHPHDHYLDSTADTLLDYNNRSLGSQSYWTHGLAGAGLLCSLFACHGGGGRG